MFLSAIRQIAAEGLSVTLGVMWLWAGTEKLRSLGSLADLRSLIHGPAWLSAVIARALPLIEIGLSFLLLMRLWLRQAAVVSAALLIFFTFILGFDYFRRALAGLPPGAGCGCFGRRTGAPVAARNSSTRNQFGTTVDISIAARNVVRPLVFAMFSCVVAFAS
jgi:uncharacterized membrane protein YphA (DoxX/SURF4 family)